MELIFYAPVWGQSGFEQLSRGLILALDQLGVSIELRPSQEWNSERVGLSPTVLSRLIRMINTRVNPLAPHVIHQVPRGQPISPDAPTICYTLFETDRCPQPWMESLLKMDKILVFSEFNRLGWIESGIPSEKIATLPAAVDSFIYNPDGPRMSIQNKKGFVFMTSGDFTERKNFEAVIEAFLKEFNGDDSVTLVIKSHYGGFIKRNRRECISRFNTIVQNFVGDKPPRILFWGDKVSEHAMAALYRSVDAFVLTSRGEGLGMQYLESMASGIPVIYADWSAHTDYLNAFNSYPVAATLKVIDDPNYIVKCPQALNNKWCQVNIDDLRATMRHVVSNYGEAREKSYKAMAWARESTWTNMAIAFIKEIVNLYKPKSGPGSVKPVEVSARGSSYRLQ